ncbi:MAG TPA: LLM class flavin-dependent oxidoreductase, partial [Aeromicrobium sp.]|nr:LLM class flavin-dependent oxidoreductase [Aeromicrobium sp.]
MTLSMQVGMTLPVMEPGVDAEMLENWTAFIDQGPFSSLCFGERMAFDNPHSLTLLGAVAAWTSRVRISTTVLVPQLHDPISLAKALATADVLSGGRLSVGVGVGGRDEDYLAAGADISTRTMKQMADRVAIMRRVWAGEKVTEAVRPVGPPPIQEGGPEILVGTLGPKTIRHAATWADGLAGFA